MFPAEAPLIEPLQSTIRPVTDTRQFTKSIVGVDVVGADRFVGAGTGDDDATGNRDGCVTGDSPARTTELVGLIVFSAAEVGVRAAVAAAVGVRERTGVDDED